jgi:hypothetical protein
VSIEKTNKTVWDYVVDNLFTTLKLIRQVDGYNFDLAEVVGWNTGDFPFRGVWPAAAIVDGSEKANDIFGTNMRRCQREIGIAMYVPSKVNVPGSPTGTFVYQQILADLEKALFVDHTRGGYAEDTEILDRAPASDDANSLIGAYLRCNVIYRHQVGDLYTKL